MFHFSFNICFLWTICVSNCLRRARRLSRLRYRCGTWVASPRASRGCCRDPPISAPVLHREGLFNVGPPPTVAEEQGGLRVTGIRFELFDTIGSFDFSLLYIQGVCSGAFTRKLQGFIFKLAWLCGLDFLWATRRAGSVQLCVPAPNLKDMFRLTRTNLPNRNRNPNHRPGDGCPQGPLLGPCSVPGSLPQKERALASWAGCRALLPPVLLPIVALPTDEA